MIIYCKQNLQKIPANLMVNKLGKYLYKHIDGAFRYKTSSNTSDVYMTLLYQEQGSDVVEEMTLDLNLTTYQNKVRVNILEVTPNERTIGYDLYPPEKLEDLNEAYKLVFNKVVKRISKAYEEYEFLF